MPKGYRKFWQKPSSHKPKDRYQDVVDFITDITTYLNSTEINKERKIGDQHQRTFRRPQKRPRFYDSAKTHRLDKYRRGRSQPARTGNTGVYYDFVNLLDGNYGVLIAESSARGAESIIFLAMLRGIIQTLINQTTDPIELASSLNKIILDQHIEQIFSFNFLVSQSQYRKL